LADNGSVVRFHAIFSQSCERFHPALQGEVLYNATADPPQPHHITSSLIAYATEGQAFKYQISTSRPETVYSATGLPAGLTLNPATGLVSGVVEEHGQFDIPFTATGQSGNAEATLKLAVDPPGRSTGPFTAVRFLSEIGDPIGQGKVASGDVGDGTFFGTRGNLLFCPWAYFGNPSDRSGYLYTQLSGPSGGCMPGIFQDTNPDLGNPDVFAVVGNAGPYATTGSLNVKELVDVANGRIDRFRASFVQYANYSRSPLRGWVWFNEDNVITSSPFAFGKEGRPFTYQIIANNEPSSYSCSGLPSGLSLNPQSGKITGSPNAAGSFIVIVNAHGPGATASEDLSLKINPAQTLANISTRSKVGLGDGSLIGGFIITGRENKKVIVRAIGPSLAGSGLTNPLSDPILELHGDYGALIASNDDWKSQQAEIEATGLAPSDDRESAIVATLAQGNYTAVINGKNGATGVGLVEVYDLDAPANAQLANISTRSFVDVGDNVLIGGFIVGFGSGQSQTRILFRALGPSLYATGISNYLRDPVLELHNGNGVTITSNDNWRDSQPAEIGATGLAPSSNSESAILISLTAGTYTAIVRGNNSGTGIALVEAYQLDD
jgi:hypothetical protein